MEVVEYKLIQDKMKLRDTSTVHAQDLILEAKPEVWRHPSIGKLPLRYHQLETRYSGPDCQKCLSAPSHKIVVGPIGCRPYNCFSPPPSSSPSVTKPIINKTSIFSWFERRIQHIIHGWKEDSTGFHLEMTKTKTKTHTKTNTRTKTELSRRKSSCIYKFSSYA